MKYGEWLEEFRCDCCAALSLDPEMDKRLQGLWEKLGDDLPRVACGYRCAESQRRYPWRADLAHSEGRAATFYTSSQSYRHSLLRALLECFDYVWIYPNRVTVQVADSPSPPLCIVM